MGRPTIETGEAKKIEEVYYIVNTKTKFTAAQLDDPTPITFANCREYFNWLAKNETAQG